MPPIVTDRVAWSVGLSVGLSPSEPCNKTAETIQMPFALRTRVGPRNHLLDIAERFEPNTVLRAFHTIQPSSLTKSCVAGLVLSVTRILRAALIKFRVNVCTCMCNYFSQTTEPICIKIIPANRASYADCYGLLRFEILTPPYLKPSKKPQRARICIFKPN